MSAFRSSLLILGFFGGIPPSGEKKEKRSLSSGRFIAASRLDGRRLVGEGEPGAAGGLHEELLLIEEVAHRTNRLAIRDRVPLEREAGAFRGGDPKGKAVIFQPKASCFFHQNIY